MRKRSSWLLTCLTLLAASAQAQTLGEAPTRHALILAMAVTAYAGSLFGIPA